MQKMAESIGFCDCNHRRADCNQCCTYGVRSELFINEVTEKDAVASGLDQVSKIVSTGCSAPKAILEDCSKEFIDIYNKSDIIISKGQEITKLFQKKKETCFFS